MESIGHFGNTVGTMKTDAFNRSSSDDQADDVARPDVLSPEVLRGTISADCTKYKMVFVVTIASDEKLFTMVHKIEISKRPSLTN